MSTLKECQVVMLPTKEKTSIGRDSLTGKLYYLPSYLNCLLNYHLYILSDDEIKKGDWCYSTIYGIAQVTKIGVSGILYFDKEHFCLGGKELKEVKKIITSTNKSLRLVEPSQGFIEKYCEKGGIDKVRVEYDWEGYGNTIWKPKISSNNTITIKPVKDSWSREEVKILLKDAFLHALKKGDNTQEDKWIKDNL